MHKDQAVVRTAKYNGLIVGVLHGRCGAIYKDYQVQWESEFSDYQDIVRDSSCM